MSFRKDIVKIMNTKNAVRSRPSAKLNAIHECGLTSQMQAFTVCHHDASAATDGASAQPAEMKPKFVNKSGAATNNKMLKSKAKAIEPTALADCPAFLAFEDSGITTLT